MERRIELSKTSSHLNFAHNTQQARGQGCFFESDALIKVCKLVVSADSLIAYYDHEDFKEGTRWALRMLNVTKKPHHKKSSLGKVKLCCQVR